MLRCVGSGAGAVRFHQLAAMLASLVNILTAFASALEYDEPMIRIGGRLRRDAGDRSFDVQQNDIDVRGHLRAGRALSSSCWGRSTRPPRCPHCGRSGHLLTLSGRRL